MKIEEVIHQKKFQYPAQKVAINVMYSASWLGGEMKRALEEFDLSWQQFNILRILKGQKGNPVSLKLLTSRMIDKTSNTSRLIEKLVKKNYVERIICPEDRRKVEISLTDEGGKIVQFATRSMDSHMHELFDHMQEKDLDTLNDLLDLMRTPD